jgi:hypothetical protein
MTAKTAVKSEEIVEQKPKEEITEVKHKILFKEVLPIATYTDKSHNLKKNIEEPKLATTATTT